MSNFYKFVLISLCFTQTFCSSSTAIFPSIREVEVVGKNELAIITNKDKIVYFINAKREIKLGVNIRKASFLNANEGWLLDENGQIWATADRGENWLKKGAIDYDANNVQNDFVFVSNQIGWLVAGLSVLLTEDGGNSWISVYPNNEFSYKILESVPTTIFPVSSDIVWLGMSNGKVLKTINRGKSWENASIPNKFDIRSLYASNEKECWAGTWSAGGLYYTNDSGKNWRQILNNEIKTNLGISSIYFATPEIGWIVGIEFVKDVDSPDESNGIMLKTTDGGKSWIQLKEEFYKTPFRKIKFTDAQNGWLIGERTIYRTTDSGNNWEEIYHVN